jgi:predicted nucleotidyltransferase
MQDESLQSYVRRQVFQFLDQKKYKVFLFGSRVNGQARKFSDVDIGIEGSERVPFTVMMQIRDAFEESSLPYFVDVVDFHNVDQKFEAVAKKNVIYLN